MIIMKKFLLILLLIAIVVPFSTQKAEAMDPVTIAILAPIALKAAEAAKPYLIKAIAGTGTGLFKIGKDAFQLLYLPYGLLEMTVGAPFHKFRSGVRHTVKGGIVAPVRLFMHILILPVYMTGAQVNI